MALKQRLLQKQVQKMIMSAKMQQSMHILQLPIVELDQLIAEELASNPVIEQEAPKNSEDPQSTEIQRTSSSADGDLTSKDKNELQLEHDWLDNDNVWFSDFFDRSSIKQAMDKHNYQETLITKSTSLHEDLIQQFRIINDNPQDIVIAEEIIGNIADNGYLVTQIEEIAQQLQCPKERIEQVLIQVQNLDPAGVGARDLKECLLIQLRRQGKGNSNEALIIDEFLSELASKKYSKISKALKITQNQVKKYAKKISELDPKPCRNYSTEALRIIPDVILEKTPTGYEIIINSKNLPKLTISQLYKKMLKNKSCSEETFNFIREKLKNAQNLINGLNQRQQTLQRVTEYIIGYQEDFIEKGIFNLLPLTLKEVAEKLSVHPSTISRTIANKYIQTPFGTFALKKLFSQAIEAEEGILSNQKIKATIDELIKTEPTSAPYSDQKIVKILKEKGIKISRRTVTKYRNELKIPPTHLRKE